MLYQRTSGLHNNYANPGIACIHSQAVMGRDENSNNFFLQLGNYLLYPEILSRRSILRSDLMAIGP